MGGFAFSLSLLWAQIFPFVALQFYKSDKHNLNSDIVTVFLACIFCLWLVLSVALFCTIDLKYVPTFISTLTAPQYAIERFREGADDFQKFDAAFDNRLSYTKGIEDEVKEWVANNIDRWRAQEEPWFKIEKIPDDYLRRDVFEAAGGARKSRFSFQQREGGENETKVHPDVYVEYNEQ